MPDNAPPLKRRRTEADGAEVIIVGPDSDERRDRARQIAAERGFVAVEPYDDLDIAAGQGTLALELLEDAGPIDQLFAPVSGGGVMAGCAAVVRSRCPDAQIIAVEPDAKPSLHQSMAKESVLPYRRQTPSQTDSGFAFLAPCGDHAVSCGSRDAGFRRRDGGRNGGRCPSSVSYSSPQARRHLPRPSEEAASRGGLYGRQCGPSTARIAAGGLGI